MCIVPQTDRPVVLGRGPAFGSDPHGRLRFARFRAGVLEPRPPLGSRRISRAQLYVEARGTQAATVVNHGRCALSHNGVGVTRADVVPGDTLRLGNEILFVCVRQPVGLRAAPPRPAPMPYGAADPHALVGESPAAWDLRRRIAQVAAHAEHLLVLGERGCGKELAARAVAAQAPGGLTPFVVARPGAPLTEWLDAAESAGCGDRGTSRGTLYVDELADLSPAQQAHLVRALDRDAGRAFRLIAATSRPTLVRADVSAHLKATLRVPGLRERLADVPLLVVHILRRIADACPAVAVRLFGGDPEGEPRLALEFVDALLRRSYFTHVREIEALLWDALTEGPDRILDRSERDAIQYA
jgi:hypothetical protein